MPSIILLTDFGHKDGYVGIMKGVIQGIYPGASVVDLAHELPPQSVSAARFILWNSYKYFPENSIFVCVVDPGVGSQRNIHVYQIEKQIFIAPENGLMDFVLAEQKIAYVFKLENPRLMGPAISQTFHGRDIFAPAAAHIARGFPLTQVGPSLDSYRLPQTPFLKGNKLEKQKASILHVDHFGNLITQIQVGEEELEFRVDEKQIPFAQTYATVKDKDFLALKGSHGLWEIAQRNGHAARELGLGVDDEIEVTLK